MPHRSNKTILGDRLVTKGEKRGTSFTMQATKSLKPPFTQETARAKVLAAQDAWNTRDPERVALAYTEDSQWRNRDEFFSGREEIKQFF